MFLTSNLFAQTFSDPEFSSRPYFLDADSTLKNLERADAQYEQKLKAMGYGGMEIYYSVFILKSDVRFSKSTLPKLIIKVEGNIDPSELFYLSKSAVKTDRRSFLQGSMDILFGGKARDVSNTYINLEFKKIRDGIFEVILPSDIQPGEYAFIPMGAPASKIKISCFGID